MLSLIGVFLRDAIEEGLHTLEGAAFSVSSFSFSTLLGIPFVTASASSLMNLNGGFT